MTSTNYPRLTPSELNHRVLPFLIRSCAVSIMNEFLDMKTMFDDDGYFHKKGKVLSERSFMIGFSCPYFSNCSWYWSCCHWPEGPAGAGKSYVLYHVVQFCRASGWLVLYIPAGESNCLSLIYSRRACTHYQLSHFCHLAGAFRNYNNKTAAWTILESFLHAEKDKLKEIEYDEIHQSLHDFIESGLREKKYFKTWKELSVFFAVNVSSES